MSEIIEKIINLLETGETYSKDAISIKISVPEHHVEEIIEFLKNFDLCETDEIMDNIKLNREFLKLLLKVK